MTLKLISISFFKFSYSLCSFDLFVYKCRNLRTSLCPSSVQLNSPDRTYSKNLVLRLAIKRDNQGQEKKLKHNFQNGKALQWQKNVKIIVQNMVIHPIIYNDVCKFTSHKLFWLWMPWGKRSNTYSKCKVRSVERIACFNSCIMLLYSLELRFAKILWPCEIKTQKHAIQ